MTAMMVQGLKEVTWQKRSFGRLFSALSFVVIYLNANLLGGKKKVQCLINIQLPRWFCECEAEVTEMVSHTDTCPGKQDTSGI